MTIDDKVTAHGYALSFLRKHKFDVRSGDGGQGIDDWTDKHLAEHFPDMDSKLYECCRACIERAYSRNEKLYQRADRVADAQYRNEDMALMQGKEGQLSFV